MYTTHSRLSEHKCKYIHVYIHVVRTRGKAIIGMALRAIIKKSHLNKKVQHLLEPEKILILTSEGIFPFNYKQTHLIGNELLTLATCR